MTVSSIGSTTNAYQVTSANSFNQLFNDFKSIGSDIQSGDLTSAQSALAAFQNDLQNNTGQNPLSQLFSNNSTLNNDLQNLQTALQSNDPTSAQTAFKTLIQDMQGAMQTSGAHRHHHHHRVNNDGRNSNSSTTSTDNATDSTSSLLTGSTLNVQA
jgi:type VI protein secretion system component VasK